MFHRVFRFFSLCIATGVTAVGMFFFRLAPVYAAGWNIVNTKLGKSISGTKLGKSSPVDIILLIIQTALGLLALCTVVLILYAGFRWMLSRGNEEEVKKAKGLLFGAVLGLLIIFASLGILEYVFTIIENATGIVAPATVP